MADEIHQYTVTIPADTPKTALYVADLALGYYDIVQVDLEVPPGPAGLMGFYLARSGQPWLPWETGEYFVWDDREKEWPLDNQPTGGGWQIVGYNLDEANDHSINVRFHVNAITATTPPPPTVTFVSAPVETVPVTL